MFNKITNWFSLLIVIWTAVRTYIDANQGHIDYYQLALAVVVAVVSFLSGKTYNSKGQVQK